jgi:hypothetical protein
MFQGLAKHYDILFEELSFRVHTSTNFCKFASKGRQGQIEIAGL